MSAVIWLDSKEARIFEFSLDHMEHHRLDEKHVEHHTHHPDGLDHQKWEREFFGRLGKNLASATRLLIVGPGVAKHHFQNYLTEHLPELGRKIVACETVDHPTDGEIAAIARTTFKLPGVRIM